VSGQQRSGGTRQAFQAVYGLQECTFMQLAHGVCLSHLILRLWQSWQARTRTGFPAAFNGTPGGVSPGAPVPAEPEPEPEPDTDEVGAKADDWESGVCEKSMVGVSCVGARETEAR
jgi:hypothetical protein